MMLQMLHSHPLSFDPFLSPSAAGDSQLSSSRLPRGSRFPDGPDSQTGDEDLPFHLAGYAPLGSKTPARGEDDKYAACSTPQSINVDALKRPGISGVRAMFEGSSKQEGESKGKKDGGGKVAEEKEAAPLSLKERMAALEKGKCAEKEVRSQAQSS
jgi:hypothetical protein